MSSMTCNPSIVVVTSVIGSFEQYYTEKLSNPWPSGRGDPRRRKERIDLTPWSSSQAQASQYPRIIPGSLETVCTGEQADLEPVNDFTPFPSSQDQASQYPLMTHGLPAIAGTLSSGACASAQYQSAGDVLTQNVPGSNVMHHQGGTKPLSANEDAKTTKKTSGVSDNDQRFDAEIEEGDIYMLAENFDTVTGLVEKLNLTPAKRGDVKRALDNEDTQAGVAMALKLWRRMDPSKATYRSLLEIVESLGRRDTVDLIRKFVSEK